MMHRRRRRAAAVVLLQKILMCAICTIALKHEFNYQKLSAEKRWMKEEAPPHLSKLQSPPHLFKTPISFHKFDGASGNLNFEKLWKPPEDRDFVPCIQPSSNYKAPDQSRGYILVRTNGGLNQMRTGVYMFYLFSSNFSDVFSEDHFINALANDVKIIKKLPKELSFATKVKHFKSGSGLEYYRDTIVSVQDARF